MISKLFQTHVCLFFIYFLSEVGDPTFESSGLSSVLSVQEGENAVLECEVRNLGENSVIWMMSTRGTSLSRKMYKVIFLFLSENHSIAREVGFNRLMNTLQYDTFNMLSDVLTTCVYIYIYNEQMMNLCS